jgi:hypothetical protein
MNRCDGFLLERVTEPEVEPVTLEQVRLHLREFAGSDADAQILELITGAREWVEDFTGRVLVDQTWRLTVTEHPALWQNVDSDTVSGYYRGPYYARSDGRIMLRKSPAIEISSINEVAADGTETLVDASTYELREADSKWPSVAPVSGSLPRNARIVFRAGYVDRTGSPVQDIQMIPQRFKQAVQLWVEAMYDRDEKMMEKLLLAAENCVRPEVVHLQFA